MLWPDFSSSSSFMSAFPSSSPSTITSFLPSSFLDNNSWNNCCSSSFLWWMLGCQRWRFILILVTVGWLRHLSIRRCLYWIACCCCCCGAVSSFCNRSLFFLGVVRSLPDGMDDNKVIITTSILGTERFRRRGRIHCCHPVKLTTRGMMLLKAIATRRPHQTLAIKEWWSNSGHDNRRRRELNDARSQRWNAGWRQPRKSRWIYFLLFKPNARSSCRSDIRTVTMQIVPFVSHGSQSNLASIPTLIS
jgi:hypothetical protein